MNRFGYYILIIVLALAAGFLGANFKHEPSTVESKHTETTYERVLRTGKLRCGYIVWSPEFKKDVNSGQFSGIAYDIMNSVAKRLNWTIEWVEEVNFTTMSAALKAKRIDGICFSLYRDSPRAVFSRFTTPLYYSGTGVFVRTDDHRFDNVDPNILNDAQYHVAIIDGEMSAITAKNKFPKTQQVGLPNTTGPTDLLLNVITGKADFTLVNTGAASEFMAQNPGKVKNIAIGNAIQLFSHGFAFQPDASDLVNTIDIALQEMLDQGEVDTILAKYPSTKDAYFRVAKSYQIPVEPK